jgi:hypothetical protein
MGILFSLSAIFLEKIKDILSVFCCCKNFTNNRIEEQFDIMKKTAFLSYFRSENPEPKF